MGESYDGVYYHCPNSILINGEPHGDIKASKDLRQGDPLSPYLFFMRTEGLHGLIKNASSNGDIRGVFVCHNEPKLTHLFFADDKLIFFAGLKKMSV